MADLVYVHGFLGAAGGSMEEALREAAEARGLTLDAPRWGSGDLTGLLCGALPCVLDRAPLRGLTKHALATWQTALAAVKPAAKTLRRQLVQDPPRAVIAYSLGARVVARALAGRSWSGLRVVLVAAATGDLPGPTDARDVEWINLYSPDDQVLRWLYWLLRWVCQMLE